MAKLTERYLDAMVPPATGSRHVYDDEVTGFGVRHFAATKRHPKGLKTFILDDHGKRDKIGRHGVWTVLAAREEAKELRRRIDRGQDPFGEKRARKLAPTVADLAERYKLEHLPRKAELSQRADWQMIKRHILPRLGAHKVADIHHGDIEALHKAISATGAPIRANRVASVLSKMFSLALKPANGETVPWRNAEQGNPVKGLDKNVEGKRERFYSPAELGRIGGALASLQTPAADCLRLVMLTGCRPGEATAATWNQFDTEPGFWIKPASTTKQRKAHKVPLGAGALELIASLRAARGEDARLFPGVGRLDHTWAKVIAAAGLEAGARVYDLRHSFASVGAGRGLSLPIIGKLLGHSVAATTLRYSHLADDPLREAADGITAQIGGKPDVAITPIRKGGAA